MNQKLYIERKYYSINLHSFALFCKKFILFYTNLLVKLAVNVRYRLQGSGVKEDLSMKENGETYVDVVADQAFLQDPANRLSNTYMHTGYNSYFGSTCSLVKFYVPSQQSQYINELL